MEVKVDNRKHLSNLIPNLTLNITPNSNHNLTSALTPIYIKPYKNKTQKDSVNDNIDNEKTCDESIEKTDAPVEDTMDISDYDVEISEEDFFDELDEGIDNYFQNLRKKK